MHTARKYNIYIIHWVIYLGYLHFTIAAYLYIGIHLNSFTKKM